MPKIINFSMQDIQDVHRWSRQVSSNVVCIQVVDPDMDFPVIKKEFKSVHQFKFLDLDYDSPQDLRHHHACIQEHQAQELANILKKAWKDQDDVVVHCHAGVCRSGAVVEAAMALGFEDTQAYRSPNRKVKHAILQALGLPWDPQEPLTINGVEFEYDDLNNKILIPKAKSPK